MKKRTTRCLALLLVEAIRAAGHPTATALIVTNSDDLPEISVVADGDAAAGTPVFKFKK